MANNQVHQHANRPKPAKGATNATEKIKMAKVVQGQTTLVEEDAPVPETHQGGYTLNAQGQPQNADGLLLDDNGVPQESVDELIAKLPDDSPQARALKAAQRKSADEDSGEAPAAPRRPSGSQRAQR